MYLVFTRMPGESYRRRLGSLLLCLCDLFRALIKSFECWFCTSVLGLVLFQTVIIMVLRNVTSDWCLFWICHSLFNHDHYKDDGVLTARCLIWGFHCLITITTKMTAWWLHYVLRLPSPHYNHYKDDGVLTTRCLFWSSHHLITITTKTTACWLHAVSFEAPIVSLRLLQRRQHVTARCLFWSSHRLITITTKTTACWLHAVRFEVPSASWWSLQRLHAVCFEAPIDSLRSLQRRRCVDFTLSVLKFPSTHYDHYKDYTLSVLKPPSTHYDHYKDDGVLTSRCLFWSSHRLITITTKTTACWLHAVCFEAPIDSLRSLQRRRCVDFTLSVLKLAWTPSLCGAWGRSAGLFVAGKGQVFGKQWIRLLAHINLFAPSSVETSPSPAADTGSLAEGALSGWVRVAA